MSCADCFQGAIHPGEPAGREEILHGVRTYIVSRNPSSDGPTIILLTDAFGFNLPNSKLADFYAAQTGLRVLVPDIIPGGGIPLSTMSLMTRVTAPVRWYDIWGYFMRAVCFFRLMTLVIPFTRRTKSAFPNILAYASAVKASTNGAKLGVAGFCWGGMMSTRLSTQSYGHTRLIDAHFCAHPAGLRPEDFVAGVRKWCVPLSMAIGDRDFVIKKDILDEITESLRRECKGCDVEVRVYDGCGHGFAVRADPRKIDEDEAAAEAAEQAVDWFKTWLLDEEGEDEES